MEVREIKKDLFKMSEDYHLAHCISSDAKMGAGIAVEFNKRFKLNVLRKRAEEGNLHIGSCHLIGRILNLITKDKFWHKPTYESLTRAVVAMRTICMQENIKKLAMPEIGCGLDRLQWGKVKEIIENTFIDTDIEIVVCRL